jgi:phosphoserine phosphatase RsbU/P
MSTLARLADLSVRRLMNPQPVRIDPSAPVIEAVETMAARRVGAILVAEDDAHLVGIFTERDFMRQCLGLDTDWRQLPVRDWMSPQPYTIHPDAGWEDAVLSMERLRVRHLPVVEEGRLIGILTARSLIARRAEHFKQILNERTGELKRANEALIARDSEMSHSMKAAAKLQKRIVLPKSPPDWPEVAWGIHFKPLDPLGGDYYDFANPDDDHLGILIADASGHGIPAAMVAIMTRLAFAEASATSIHPGEVLSTMNRRLTDMGDERFVTAFYGILNRRTMKFTYANAGHPFPFAFRADTGSSMEISARGFMLGVMPEEIYQEKSLQLKPGDRLCFYTDGLPDCRDERGETLGIERLAGAFAESARLAASQMVGRIVATVNAHRGTATATDDMTMVLAEIRST